MAHISTCPLDPYGTYLYSTDDPDVVAEVTLYRKDIKVSEVVKRAEALEQAVAPKKVEVPVGASSDVKAAVESHNMMFAQERDRVEQGKVEAVKLREWIAKADKAKVKVR